MGDSGLVDYLTSLPLRRIDDYVVESSAAQVMCRKFESDFPYYSVTTVVDSSVMGHVMKNGLDLIGTGRTTRLDPEFKADFDRMVELSDKQTGLSASEKNHVKALQLFADGHMALAANIWEDILIDHPLDMLALKFAHDSYFYLGQSNQIRDSIARVLKHYQPSNPFYGYHFGMYSFGLEETNLYDQAEKMARKGLEINPGDAWSTHTICHVMEMMGRQDEGISFLDKTVKDWEPRGLLACHNFWHWALYYIEKGEYQAALDILDTQVKVRASKSGALLDIVDSSSLLFRLQMEGVNIGDRWEDVFELCRPHLDDHILVFNDIHFLLGCLGAGKADATKYFINSFEEFVRDGAGCQHDVAGGVGQTLCQAFVSYSAGDFASVVDLLYPIRYQIISIGGSHAQAAIKSSRPRHHCLARYVAAGNH
ncbi:hypothetical protein C0Q70_07221 [Pomacea canaliculata]|uniref:Tetratricopeptide repeat protein 38 n=1 Tax=Pomacea canaliculata TaxID=400727 RepID=A0A2T7PEG8_POMCA|nr:hypothetical protein C0Q70_07221 [Pomacea canaliculata]